jgi:hypothetical protein
MFAAGFAPPTAGWKCPACNVDNKSDAAECACCETPNPSKKPKDLQPTVVPSSKPSGSMFAAGFAPPTAGWKCPACNVDNKSDAVECVCCETPNPSKKPKDLQLPSGSTFAAGFAPSVVNKSDVFPSGSSHEAAAQSSVLTKVKECYLMLY